MEKKKLIINILKIIIMAGLVIWLDLYGFAVIGIYYLLWALYRLFFVGWNDFIRSKELIESTIWGQPLKEFKKGELKNHKVEIVWSKKNEYKTNTNRKPKKKHKR